MPGSSGKCRKWHLDLGLYIESRGTEYDICIALSSVFSLLITLYTGYNSVTLCVELCKQGLEHETRTVCNIGLDSRLQTSNSYAMPDRMLDPLSSSISDEGF